ncbi:transposase [Pseudovibrio exalbescens]|uniref:transposase n=1 Tax=Pseudovibrio exalbescens TaxID=197461 RepID=UPI000C9BAA0B|nr:transposase [Pseudovibrio exalbescens]
MTHFHRNVFSRVPSTKVTKVQEVTHVLKAIHAQGNSKAAQKEPDAVIENLRAQRLTRTAELIEESLGERLTY